MRRRARAGDGRCKREQAPGGDVVDRRSRKRQGADGVLQHPALDEDAREHRKRGDRHRDAYEEGEREIAFVRRERLVGRQGDQEAERERNGDARVRDEGRLPDPRAQRTRVELHPHEEEVEGEPDLGDGRDERDDVLREEVALGPGPDLREERRPEEDPAEHLAHHTRLRESAERHAEEAGGDDDGRDREHEPAERLLG